MRIGIYGGSFDPPHLGHRRLAETALNALRLDRLILMPAGIAPHKRPAENAADPETRLALCRLAFGDLEKVGVSDLEVRREGPSYTSDTLEEIRKREPEARLVLLLGTDMLLTMEQWVRFRRILELAELAVLPRGSREDGALQDACLRLRERYGASVTLMEGEPVPVSSTEVRRLLPQRRGRELLAPAVYAEIIRRRLYGAKPELAWLRETAFPLQDPARLDHVRGCEETAAALALRWGADPEDAREAAILHDLTKKYDLAGQLKLCEKYDIIADTQERADGRLLHAITSAAMAGARFGCPGEIVSAIRWHTTGRAGMTLLEKIVCLADFMEPTRHFADLTRVRSLAFTDLDAALLLSFEMTLLSLERRGIVPHGNTRSAMEDLKRPGEDRDRR